MVGWILGKLKWLLIVAAIGGPVSAYVGWTDVDRVNQVVAKGVETEALITGATRKKGRKSGTSYYVDITWKDSKGEVQRASDIHMSGAMARKLIRDDKIVVDSVRIKHLAELSGKDGVVLVDDANEELDLDRFMMYGGAIVGLIGIIGCALMFGVFGRRKSRTSRYADVANGSGQGAA